MYLSVPGIGVPGNISTVVLVVSGTRSGDRVERKTYYSYYTVVLSDAETIGHQGNKASVATAVDNVNGCCNVFLIELRVYTW